jgi:hypothetical protein
MSSLEAATCVINFPILPLGPITIIFIAYTPFPYETYGIYNEDSFILAYLSNERKFGVRDQNIIFLIKIGLAFFKTIR